MEPETLVDIDETETVLWPNQGVGESLLRLFGNGSHIKVCHVSGKVVSRKSTGRGRKPTPCGIGAPNLPRRGM
jgi:hypothetical protein